MLWWKKKLLDVQLIAPFSVKLLSKIEKGQLYSSSFRYYMKKNFNVDIGYYTYGGCFAKNFNMGGMVKIGRYCSIAENVRYLSANHPINNFSTSPLFYNPALGYKVIDIQRGKLNIGNDVWIGANVLILPNCRKIGNGAIIGAGTVITKDVDAFSIVVGNPGKVLGYRFSNDTINSLEKISWWDNSPDIIMKYHKYFDNAGLFINEWRKENEYNK